MTNYHVNTNDCCGKRLCCNWIAFIIFAALFLFALGLIIGGAVLSAVILANIAAFSVLAAILFVLAVVALIVQLCNCADRRCE